MQKQHTCKSIHVRSRIKSTNNRFSFQMNSLLSSRGGGGGCVSPKTTREKIIPPWESCQHCCKAQPRGSEAPTRTRARSYPSPWTSRPAPATQGFLLTLETWPSQTWARSLLWGPPGCPSPVCLCSSWADRARRHGAPWKGPADPLSPSLTARGLSSHS